MNNKIELLAPAGSWEALVAAVQNGADAVYLGARAFNARAFAANFSDDDINRAIDYAHLRNVRIHAVLNILLHDREMNEAIDIAGKLYESGADALIVQDVGLIRCLRNCFPDLPLHASTQMAISSAGGLRFARELGMSRVVLAREMSLEDMKMLRKDSDIELEAFAHGAMCTSISGLCLHSSFIGERSGNRGQCAQPCRMKYKALDEQSYLLSMKDMCTIDHIGDLRDAGICSLKIEGRMKRPEYVAVVVKAYREVIDGANPEQYKGDLLQIFNRGGFSKGYILGNDKLIADDHPGHSGKKIGKVASGGAQIFECVNAGDEISTRSDETDHKIKLKGALNKGFVNIKINGRIGDDIYKLSDSALDMRAKESIKCENAKTYVSAKFRAVIGNKASISLRAGNIEVNAEGEEVQAAKSSPIDKKKVYESLSKMGGTPFELDCCECEIEEGAFVSTAALNSLRREAVEALEAALTQSFKRQKKACSVPLFSPCERGEKPAIIAQCSRLDQARTALLAGASAIYFRPVDYSPENIELWNEFAADNNVYFVQPPFVSPNSQPIVDRALSACSNFKGAVATNVGQIIPLREKFREIFGDFTLNALNATSANEFIQMGLSRIALSAELNFAQMRDIMDRIPCELIVYGNLPTMYLRHCLIRQRFGKCLNNCAEGITLSDRKGFEFIAQPITFEKRDCLWQILNSLPLDLLKHFNDCLSLKAAYWRLNFYNETPDEVAQRVKAYADALNGLPAMPLGNSTSGHFKRGV